MAAPGKASVILATAGYDHTVRFWEATTGKCYRELQHPDSQVNCLKVTPDKKYLTVAGNQHIRLYDIASSNASPVSISWGLCDGTLLELPGKGARRLGRAAFR